MKIDTKIGTVTIARITWHEQYNCYSAKIADWFNLSFSYSTDRSDPGYKISVGGRFLKHRAKDPQEAASIAVKTAKVMLAKAIAEIEQETTRQDIERDIIEGRT